MKKQLTYLLLSAAALMIAACSSSRHSVTATVRINDTIKITLHDTFTIDKWKVEKMYVHDTVIVTAGAAAVQTIRPRQMIPGATYYTKSGHVSNTATIDSSGNIHIRCEADSLKTVVRNLIQHTITQDKEIKRLSSLSTDSRRHTDISYSEYYKKTKSWIAGNWWWLMLAAIIWVLIEVIYRAKKHRERNPLL